MLPVDQLWLMIYAVLAVWEMRLSSLLEVAAVILIQYQFYFALETSSLCRDPHAGEHIMVYFVGDVICFAADRYTF